jgi:hypothetical protein
MSGSDKLVGQVIEAVTELQQRDQPGCGAASRHPALPRLKSDQLLILPSS